MAKKRIKVTLEIVMDEETYEEYAKGKSFKEVEEELKAAFDDEAVKDVDVTFEEVRDEP